MNRELLAVIAQIGREKGIDSQKIVSAVEMAVQTAAKKRYGANENVQAHLDPETGEIEVVSLRKVVETVANPKQEVSLDEAKGVDSGAELGEFQLPSGLCIDPRNRIYVADSLNQRIQIFQFTSAPRPAKGSGR